MDIAPLILILTPILMPVFINIGVDPVSFGMIILVNLGIGLMLPTWGPYYLSVRPSPRSVSKVQSIRCCRSTWHCSWY